MRRSIHADGVELTAAEMIDGDVVGDLEKPTGELELRPIPVDVVQYLDEGVLREILGEFTIANHPVDEREHRTFVSADQLTKRGFSPCLREGDNVRVWQVGEIERRGHAR